MVAEVLEQVLRELPFVVQPRRLAPFAPVGLKPLGCELVKRRIVVDGRGGLGLRRPTSAIVCRSSSSARLRVQPYGRAERYVLTSATSRESQRVNDPILALALDGTLLHTEWHAPPCPVSACQRCQACQPGACARDSSRPSHPLRARSLLRSAKRSRGRTSRRGETSGCFDLYRGGKREQCVGERHNLIVHDQPLAPVLRDRVDTVDGAGELSVNSGGGIGIVA